MNRRALLEIAVSSIAAPCLLTQRVRAQPALPSEEIQRIRDQIELFTMPFAPTFSKRIHRSKSVGAIGSPENELQERIPEHWDEWLGAAFAARALYLIHWELYCNEPAKAAKDAPLPLKDPAQLRGFWLVKPDGSLSQSGKYLVDLWKRSGDSK